MSNYVMRDLNRLMKRLFGKKGVQRTTNPPFSELLASDASDIPTRKYVDEINGINSETGQKVSVKVGIDGKELVEATKVLKTITNEANKATVAIKSLTKAQIEAKRAQNRLNLSSKARNRQNVASKPPELPKEPTNEEFDPIKAIMESDGFSSADKEALQTFLDSHDEIETVRIDLDGPFEDLEGSNCSDNPSCDGDCCKKDQK